MDNELKSPTRMSKTEIKEELIKCGYEDSKINTMKRPELLDTLREHRKGQKTVGFVITENQDDEDDVGIEITTPFTSKSEFTDTLPLCSGVVTSPSDTRWTDDEPTPPSPSDPEWTQYVLGLFMDDEVDGKNPRVEGLRRVAGLLVGELMEEGCDLIATPCEDNRYRACCKAWGIFLTPMGTKRFEALADANQDNCMDDFSTYLVSMADTRAKGRMFRNALGLKRVVAAEEINKTLSLSTEIQPGGSVHAGQIAALRLIAGREDFHIPSILEKLGIECKLSEKTGDVDLTNLTYQQATDVVREMRQMMDNKGKDND